MKRLLRIFAFLGSVGVIGWLVRNRIVSVTMNREPEKPEPAPEPAPAGSAADQPEGTETISPSEAD